MSKEPASRLDIVSLQEELDKKLGERKARETGECLCVFRWVLIYVCIYICVFYMCMYLYMYLRIIFFVFLFVCLCLFIYMCIYVSIQSQYSVSLIFDI